MRRVVATIELDEAVLARLAYSEDPLLTLWAVRLNERVRGIRHRVLLKPWNYRDPARGLLAWIELINPSDPLFETGDQMMLYDDNNEWVGKAKAIHQDEGKTPAEAEDLPDDLNPGIVETVKRLRAAGFDTTDSGDGETHDHECDREYGYVVAMTLPARLVSEVDRMVALLREWGLEVVSEGWEPPESGRVVVEGSYHPVDDVALIDVRYIHDRMLEDEQDERA